MFAKESYAGRRAELKKLMSEDGGLVLLPGNVDSPMNYPENCYKYRQDSTFLYFFGHSVAGLAGVIDLDSGEEMLFGNDLTMNDIIWTGPQPTVAEMGARVGVSITRPLADMAKMVTEAIAKGRKVHYLPPYRGETTIALALLLGVGVEQVAAGASAALALSVVALRSVKSGEELVQIEQACAVGYKMHMAAMKMCRPGIMESEVAGAMEGIALQYGAGVSFLPIVSQNGETLHNHSHHQMLTEGRLLLMDAGAENEINYCSDFTRTIPVSGKFSPMQADIYNIALAANDLAQHISAPGKLYRDVHLEAVSSIVDGLKALGLMRGDTDEAVANGAHALFMPHGLGHMMGLDVHDMENIGEKYVGYDKETERSKRLGLSSLRLGRRLQPGMVMTVEPGIYFIPAYIAKWKAERTCADFINFSALDRYSNFGGIRIEDNITITADGCRLLGERLPATVAEVEEAMTS